MYSTVQGLGGPTTIRDRDRYLLAFVLLLAALSGASAYLKNRELSAKPPRAVILDALNKTSGPGFTVGCASLLQSHGYAVDIHKGADVTVEAVKGLRGYRIIVLRVHSGVFEGGAWLFTGEEYSGSEHVVEQLSGEAHMSRNLNDPRLMFAVGSGFVRHYLGGLDGCLVVLMGCDGLAVDDLASALCGAGASAVVGWGGAVALDETDEAVLFVLGEVLEGTSLGAAVDDVNTLGGYGSPLLVYPEAGRAWRVGG